jgi:hypothetical protein
MEMTLELRSSCDSEEVKTSTFFSSDEGYPTRGA